MSKITYKDIETRSKSANKNKNNVNLTNTNKNTQTTPIITNLNQSINHLKTKLFNENQQSHRGSSVKSMKTTKQNAEKLIEDIQLKINNLINTQFTSNSNKVNIKNDENQYIHSYSHTSINDIKEKGRFDFSSKYFPEETSRPGKIFRFDKKEKEKDAVINSLTNQIRLIKRNYPFDVNHDKIILHKGYFINENNQFALISDGNSKEFTWVHVGFVENSKLQQHMKEIPNLKEIENEFLQQKQVISMLKSKLTSNNNSLNPEVERIRTEKEERLVTETRLKTEEVYGLNEKINKMAAEISKQVGIILDFQSKLSTLSEENSLLVYKLMELNRKGKVDKEYSSNWKKEEFEIEKNDKIEYIKEKNSDSQVKNDEIIKFSIENTELKEKVSSLNEKVKSQEYQINELIKKALENEKIVKDLKEKEILIIKKPDSTKENHIINCEERNLLTSIQEKDALIETLTNEINLLKASQFESDDKEEGKVNKILKSVLIFNEDSQFLIKQKEKLYENMKKNEDNEELLSIMYDYVSFLYKIYEEFKF